MHDHPILKELRSRQPAMLAELRRLVEHESPSHDKPALDAFANLLARRLDELGGRTEVLPNAQEATTSSLGFPVRADEPRSDPHSL